VTRTDPLRRRAQAPRDRRDPWGDGRLHGRPLHIAIRPLRCGREPRRPGGRAVWSAAGRGAHAPGALRLRPHLDAQTRWVRADPQRTPTVACRSTGAIWVAGR